MLSIRLDALPPNVPDEAYRPPSADRDRRRCGRKPIVQIFNRLGTNIDVVHRLACHEMFHLSFDLRRTAHVVGTIIGGFAFHTEPAAFRIRDIS